MRNPRYCVIAISAGFLCENKMQDLLNVRNEVIGGAEIQAVSARELYLSIGLMANKWSRWFDRNIIRSEFFSEGKDWVGLPFAGTTVLGGKVARDFAISIDFAKHLALMAKTAKGHFYRNYLINLEKHVVENFTSLSDDDRTMLELTRISPDTLKAITGERNNHKVRQGYQALVQAGIFEEVRETREVLRYRPTAAGFDWISGCGGETPHFNDIHKEQVRFIINQFKLGLGFQVDLFLE